jgi:MFS family permease
LQSIAVIEVNFGFPVFQLKTQTGSPSDFEEKFSLLYSLPALPNVILPFFGGYFINRFGVNSCLVVFLSLLLAGHITFSVGVSMNSWGIMYLGRIIGGLGETNTNVANSTILAHWFAGQELALAFGLNIAMGRMGSAVNNMVSPHIASTSGGVTMAVWFGAVMLGLSCLAVFLLIVLESRSVHQQSEQCDPASENHNHLENEKVEIRSSDRSSSSSSSSSSSGSGGSPSSHFPVGAAPAAAHSSHTTGVTGAINLIDLSKLPLVHYLLCCQVFLVYGTWSAYDGCLSCNLHTWTII